MEYLNRLHGFVWKIKGEVRPSQLGRVGLRATYRLLNLSTPGTPGGGGKPPRGLHVPSYTGTRGHTGL